MQQLMTTSCHKAMMTDTLSGKLAKVQDESNFGILLKVLETLRKFSLDDSIMMQ